MGDMTDPLFTTLSRLDDLDDKSLTAEVARIHAETDARYNKLRRQRSMVYAHMHRDGKKCCSDPNEVLGYIIQKVDNKDNIIMYIEDAKEYVLIKDINEYKNFMINTAKTRDNLEFQDYKKYRVILEDTEHNLVLMYKHVDADTEHRLLAAIKAKFGGNILTIDNNHYNARQISTDVCVSGLAESKSKCEELREYIASTDADIASHVQTLISKLDIMTGKRYVLSAVEHETDNVFWEGNSSSVSFDLSRPQVVINVAFNGPIINGNVINNVVAPAIPHRYADSIAWIRANNPQDRESIKTYYARYEAHMKSVGKRAYPGNQIYRYVEDCGFKRKQSTNSKIWVARTD